MFSPPWHTTSWREITLERWLSADISVTAQYFLPGPQEPAQNISEAFGHNGNKSWNRSTREHPNITPGNPTVLKDSEESFILSVSAGEFQSKGWAAHCSCLLLCGGSSALVPSPPCRCVLPTYKHCSKEGRKRSQTWVQCWESSYDTQQHAVLMWCSCVSILNGAKHPRHWGAPAQHHHSGVTLTAALLIN